MKPPGECLGRAGAYAGLAGLVDVKENVDTGGGVLILLSLWSAYQTFDVRPWGVWRTVIRRLTCRQQTSGSLEMNVWRCLAHQARGPAPQRRTRDKYGVDKTHQGADSTSGHLMIAAGSHHLWHGPHHSSTWLRKEEPCIPWLTRALPADLYGTRKLPRPVPSSYCIHWIFIRHL